MAVVDYTSQLALGTDMAAFNDRYCVLGAGDVVTDSFSGTVNKTINAIVANFIHVFVVWESLSLSQ